MAAPSIPPTLRKVARLWEIPFVGLLAWLMFSIRMLPYDKLVQGGRAYYIGTDPFYHYREVLGGVRAWPQMPRFDPYTFYPWGTGTGQFGSLFDWVASTYIVMTAGRDASEEYIAQVLAAYPAVLGALLIIPFYFLAKRLLGTAGAVVASVTLAVLPGEFLIRSVAGYSDHHVAEALMAIVAILGVYVAVQKANEKRDAIADDWRNVKAYWPALAWGALAGVAVAAEFYTWPPAILFLGILTLWLTIMIVLDVGRGHSPWGYVAGGSTAFAVAGLLMVPAIETTFLGEFNTYGILHVLGLLGAAAWLAAVAAAAVAVRARDGSPWIVPGGIAGLAVVSFFALKFVAPNVYGSLRWGLSWITGIGVPRTTLTISEARPAALFCREDTGVASCLGNDFGIVAPVATLVLFALVFFAAWKRRGPDILLLIWSLVIFQATRTQIRFSYYLALNMALLIGWLGARLAEGAAAASAPVAAPTKGTKGRRTAARVQTDTAAAPWRAAVAVVALLLVLPGNVLATEKSRPSWQIADQGFQGPDSDLVMWMDALEWMRNNTPDGGVDLGRIVPIPEPGTHFEQAPGSYGVLSWWDYGHWMEVVARRAPVANPFQQAAPFASCWFTEQDPDRAEVMLRQWSQRDWHRPNGQPCDELAYPAPSDYPRTDENPVRYLMIDDEMAAGKFGAITVWAGCDECLAFNRTTGNEEFTSRDAYYHALFQYWKTFRGTDGVERNVPWSGEPYHDTMLARLYFDDGSRLENYRLVHEVPYGVRIGWVAGFGDGGFYSHNQMDIISGRQGWRPEEYGRTGDTMHATGDNRWVYDSAVVSSVKTYERVKGAELAGTGAEPGSQVTVAVQLQSETTARQFTWRASTTAAEDGTFRLVVPYATTDILPPEEGGTNLAVRALGPAQLFGGSTGNPTHRAEIAIPDAAVLEGRELGVALTQVR